MNNETRKILLGIIVIGLALIGLSLTIKGWKRVIVEEPLIVYDTIRSPHYVFVDTTIIVGWDQDGNRVKVEPIKQEKLVLTGSYERMPKDMASLETKKSKGFTTDCNHLEVGGEYIIDLYPYTIPFKEAFNYDTIELLAIKSGWVKLQARNNTFKYPYSDGGQYYYEQCKNLVIIKQLE